MNGMFVSRKRSNSLAQAVGRFLGILAALLVLVASFCRPAKAQIFTSNVVGTVTDPSGAVIPKAKCTLVSVQTGVQQTTETNGVGDYVFQYLQPGTYTLTVSARGFKKFVHENIVISTLSKVSVNVTLEPGAVTQKVTVRAATPLLQTQTGEQSITFPERQITDLPLNRANDTAFNVLDQVKLLSPGVVMSNNATWTVSEGGIVRRDQDYVDGAMSTLPVWSGQAMNPAPDSIQEIKVMTNSFSAVYSNTGGSILLATTKSGTNQYHGDVYEYLENNAMNAGDALAHVVPKEAFNQPGFTFGGPVPKTEHKLFFFGDAYWIRNFSQTAFDGLTVPDASWRSGDFSNVLGPQVGTDALGRPIFKNEIFNPTTLRAVTAGQPDSVTGLTAAQTGYVRDPFPGNIIPSSAMSGPALKLQGLYPSATCPSCILQNYTSVQPAFDKEYAYDIRMDYYMRPQDKLMGRYSEWHDVGFGGQPFPGLGGGGLAPGITNSSNPVLDWVHTFGPSTTNEAHASYIHEYETRIPVGYGSVGLSTYGITGLPNANQPLGVPDIGWGGFQGSSGVWFLGSRYDTLELQGQADIFFDDVLTMVRGKHTIQVGGEDQRMQINNNQPDPSNTGWHFNNDFTDQYTGTGVGSTGWDYASFLVGDPFNLQYKAFPNFADVRSSVYSLFAQDDFRVKPNLTLNLGLRWDAPTWWYGVNNTIGAIYTFNPANATTAFHVLGQNGFRQTQWNNSWVNIEPRFGLAWSPKWLKDTVVRGGFAVFTMGQQNGGAQGGVFPLNPGWFTIFDNGLFNSEAINSALSPLATLSNIPFTPFVPTLNPNPGQVPNTNPMDTSYQWNFGVQHELPGQMMLNVAYTGAHDIHLPFGGYSPNVIPLSQIGTCKGSATCLPYPQYISGALGISQWLGSNEYNALQISAQKRFSQGLTFNLGYTWEKNITLGQYGYVNPVGNRYLDRAWDPNSVPQAFTFSYDYQLPAGPGRRWLTRGPLVPLLGGWHWSGVIDLQSGYPLSPGMGFNSCPNCGIASNQPNLVSSPVPSGFTQNNGQWFNPGAFTIPALYTVGNAGYGLLFGPSMSTVDFSVGKSFYFPKLGESRYLQFRADFFNAFNTPYWGNPVLNVQSPSAGMITGEAGAYAPRVIQLGLKFVF